MPESCSNKNRTNKYLSKSPVVSGGRDKQYQIVLIAFVHFLEQRENISVAVKRTTKYLNNIRNVHKMQPIADNKQILSFSAQNESNQVIAKKIYSSSGEDETIFDDDWNVCKQFFSLSLSFDSVSYFWYFHE